MAEQFGHPRKMLARSDVDMESIAQGNPEGLQRRGGIGCIRHSVHDDFGERRGIVPAESFRFFPPALDPVREGGILDPVLPAESHGRLTTPLEGVQQSLALRGGHQHPPSGISPDQISSTIGIRHRGHSYLPITSMADYGTGAARSAYEDASDNEPGIVLPRGLPAAGYL